MAGLVPAIHAVVASADARGWVTIVISVPNGILSTRASHIARGTRRSGCVSPPRRDYGDSLRNPHLPASVTRSELTFRQAKPAASGLKTFADRSAGASGRLLHFPANLVLGDRLFLAVDAPSMVAEPKAPADERPDRPEVGHRPNQSNISVIYEGFFMFSERRAGGRRSPCSPPNSEIVFPAMSTLKIRAICSQAIETQSISTISAARKPLRLPFLLVTRE